MGAKIITILLIISLSSIAYTLKCYQCEIGLAVTDHACLDPTNADLEPKIKEMECRNAQDVCATVVYPHNMKRECGVAITEGQPYCSRGEEAHETCTTCTTDLCNSEKSGGAQIMALSTALIVTLFGSVLILQ